MPTPENTDLLQAARCEDLVYEQIIDLAVVGQYETKALNSLMQPGAHLLEGARGVGKSMLLRSAEVNADKDFKNSRILTVYVNFKTSTLLEGVKAGERNGFQVWVNAKILAALHEKLVFLDLIRSGGEDDPYTRVFGIKSVEETKTYLEDKIHLLQRLTMSKNKDELVSNIGADFLEKVFDTSYLCDVIKNVIDKYKLERIIFLFDEAAHTFIPEQQEIFFEIFKLIHGGRIAVKAAVYPTVTSYGRNFEVGQDAIVLGVDRYEPGEHSRLARRQQFREIIEKRIPTGSKYRKMIFQKGELLDICIDLSTGNPRAFLHILNRAIDDNFTERAVMLAAQNYVDEELLPYHINLCKRLPKYSAHVRTGLDLLRGYIIPEIRSKNHRTTKSEYQCAFFTVPRDISPNLKLSLDILCYSGILIDKDTVKIANRQTGRRYMVNLALLTTEKAFSSSKLTEAFRALSLTDYREFSSTDSQIETFIKSLCDSSEQCTNCSSMLSPNAKFCAECGQPVSSKSIISGLLEEPVENLSISSRLKSRIKPWYKCVGDVVQAPRADIMKIRYIKEVRSRIIKNAADEFISG